MSKKLLFGMEAKEALQRGIDKVANAVKITLGPKGRNVVLETSYGAPLITNDGVSIAKEIDLEDPFENMGAQLLKEVAIKTNDVAGDGTTTATVLAQAMIQSGLTQVIKGSNPVAIKRGINKAVDVAVEKIKEISTPISGSHDIARVASISANDESVGKLIAEAMEKVTKDGVITIEESKITKTKLNVVEGMQFDRGFLSPYMVTDSEKMEAVLDMPYILVTDKKINNIQEILPLLEQVAKENRKLYIIADDLLGDTLATLVVNKLRGTFNCVAVKAPSFGNRRKELLQDIAILTGATYISEDLGIELSSIDISYLGVAKQVKVSKDTSIIIDGCGKKEDIKVRKNEIKNEIKNVTSNYDKEKLEERLAKLIGGVAVIEVGAVTETEMKEKKLRIEDALNATKAATSEGIVAGGGIAYIISLKEVENLSKTLNNDEKIGADMVKNALKQPLLQIAINSGVDGEEILNKVKNLEENIGYDAENDRYVDMKKEGIVDPAKVTIAALKNAASIASMVITTETLVVNDKKENKINEESMNMY